MSKKNNYKIIIALSVILGIAFIALVIYIVLNYIVKEKF